MLFTALLTEKDYKRVSLPLQLKFEKVNDVE
jgi:hypothetical protein